MWDWAGANNPEKAGLSIPFFSARCTSADIEDDFGWVLFPIVSEPVCPGLLLNFQKFCKSIVKHSHDEVNYVSLHMFLKNYITTEAINIQISSLPN